MWRRVLQMSTAVSSIKLNFLKKDGLEMITGYLLLTFVRCGPCLLEEGNLQWQIAGIPGDQKNSDVFPGPTHARLVLASYFFPGGKILYSHSKESACNAGDQGVIPRSGRSPGGGNGNPPQYSCLENPKDRGAWPATVHGVAKSQPWLSN